MWTSAMTTTEAATRTQSVTINLEVSHVHASLLTSATDSAASVSCQRFVFTSSFIAIKKLFLHLHS